MSPAIGLGGSDAGALMWEPQPWAWMEKELEAYIFSAF